MRRWFPTIAGLCLLAAVVALALRLRASHLAPKSPPQPPPLRHDVYIWQRTWNDSVTRAVEQSQRRFGECVALAAEVSFRDGNTTVAHARIDYPALQAARVSVGLALRIGPYRGTFSEDDPTAIALCNLAREIVTASRAAGVEPVELQIDFDAAESQLAGYRMWIRAIHRAVAPLQVTITALPAWLDRPALHELLVATDGYVLQVHSVQRPRGPDAAMTLCDVDQAKKWTERAGKLPVRFRVALPTYAYLAGFAPSGNLIGLSAEGPGPQWPAGTTIRRLEADPAGMAELVRTWNANHPPLMTGIIWYRLPVDQDSMNWRSPTLAAVMQGREPAPDLRVISQRDETGTIEIELHNAGDADAALDRAEIFLSWDGAHRVASDGIRGFAVLDAGPHGLTLQPTTDAARARLHPGERIKIGWVRLSVDKEVHGHVQSLAP
jgi:hypothetical protein